METTLGPISFQYRFLERIFVYVQSKLLLLSLSNTFAIVATPAWQTRNLHKITQLDSIVNTPLLTALVRYRQEDVSQRKV